MTHAGSYWRRRKLPVGARGVRLGFLRAVDGGLPIASVVSEKAESLIPKKHLGPISYTPLVMQCAAGMSSVLFDWINASWTGKAQRKDGSIVTADVNLTIVNQRDFVQALITETTIPALDGSSKDPAYLTVTLAPEPRRPVLLHPLGMASHSTLAVT